MAAFTESPDSIKPIMGLSLHNYMKYHIINLFYIYYLHIYTLQYCKVISLQLNKFKIKKYILHIIYVYTHYR